MADVFAYLEREGDRPLTAAPFCEVDGMILARLSYAPLELLSLPREKTACTMGEAAGRLLEMPDLAQQVLWQEDVRLLRALRDSRRFRDMAIHGWMGEADERSQTQFFAVLVQLRDREYYLSFRGTDDTLVGWKENLNMGFLCPVPAQELAASYLEQTAGGHKGRFRLGGHSKGGNLAVYAAAFCTPSVRARIDAVYNYDGPGFDPVALNTAGYREMRARVHTFVPQGSIVGMLLCHEGALAVVRSSQSNGVLQHDVYSWEIEGNRFARLENVTNASRWIGLTLQDWLEQLSREEKRRFVDTLYAVVRETRAETLKELGENWPENAVSVLKSLQGLDPSTRKAVADTLNRLGQSAAKGAWIMVRQEGGPHGSLEAARGPIQKRKEKELPRWTGFGKKS